MSEALAEGRAALLAAEWETAAAAFERALPDPAALDGLGEVRWFQGRVQEGVALREQAYAEFCRRGDRLRAGAIALWLVVEVSAAPAVAGGWLRRAERLLEGLPEAPAHVELEVCRARRADTAAAAEALYERALEIARRIGSIDGEIRTLTVMGMQRVATGDVDAGLALLDEAMAAVRGGEVTDPWVVGSACCMMLAACDTAADWPRAMQWCREIVPLIERKGQMPLWAWCRSVYGGVLTAIGDWERAERELLGSLRTFGSDETKLVAAPLVRLAELRIRQGRYEEAERLVEEVEGDARAAAAGIALMLARGNAAAAAAGCERRLERVGRTSPAAAGLLPLLAAAELELGDLDAVDAAVADLAELGRALKRPDLVAEAELVAAPAALARGRADAAAAHLEAALDLFGRLGMPLGCARARLGLARVHEAHGQDELSVQEARRALKVFERLGARPDADEAAALLRRLGESGRSAPRLGAELTARELEVLALLGEGLSNPEIARRLVISPKTAEHHVSRILRKLDLTSRAEAAAHAARLGVG